MADDIRSAFWKALDDSPFLMVGLTGGKDHREPMTAQIDKDARSRFWFYTTRQNRLAGCGPAMAQFAAKGHDLFACIAGTLTEETDPAVIDRHWSKHAEALFQRGRDDPDLLMLRFDLADAEIWEVDISLEGRFHLATGQRVDISEVGEHADVSL